MRRSLHGFCSNLRLVRGHNICNRFDSIPAMIKHGYPVSMAASIQASSAELGVIIPPSVPLILFAVSTQTSVTQLFLAGLGPGLLIAGSLIVMVQVWCRIKGYGKDDGADKLPIIPSFVSAFWALMMPVIILGGILWWGLYPHRSCCCCSRLRFVSWPFCLQRDEDQRFSGTVS